MKHRKNGHKDKTQERWTNSSNTGKMDIHMKHTGKMASEMNTGKVDTQVKHTGKMDTKMKHTGKMAMMIFIALDIFDQWDAIMKNMPTVKVKNFFNFKIRNLLSKQLQNWKCTVWSALRSGIYHMTNFKIRNLLSGLA